MVTCSLLADKVAPRELSRNDTGANYNAQAAQEAWDKTLAWFDKYLKA